MNSFSRRDFILAASGLAGLSAASLSALPKSAKPLLSFSTLGCPKWSFDTILQYATDNQYNGIEIRGIQGQLDLSKCAEFSNATTIATTRKKVEDKGLRIVDLGSSAQLHHASPDKRKSNLDEAKRFIDLAQQLNCPFVRVFPNDLPKDQDRNSTIDLIINGLLELGNYAKGSKVTVLLESHGEVVGSALLNQIMKAAEHPHVGLIWDIFNMWLVTKESPTMVHQQLSKYIRHVHVKDAKIINGKEQYVLLGQGEAPVAEAIAALVKSSYKGYYSFEWEKLWHPEIDEPEVAIPAYPKAMQQYFVVK
ncbi:MAG: sugar phosphate isomerase/epimerase family protein [Spirosomataceae bacterium]